jgi:hypothetical protein
MATMSNMLANKIGEKLHVTVTGAQGPVVGKLVSVEDNYFVLETHWSKHQYFDLTKLVTFWAEEG